MNEVQVICTVMSADKHIDPDIPAMIGTSAALAISGCPFNGPIGGARVGFNEAQGYMLNPTYEQLADSKLNMVVAGTKDAVLMVESEAQGTVRRPDAGCGTVRSPGNAGCYSGYSTNWSLKPASHAGNGKPPPSMKSCWQRLRPGQRLTWVRPTASPIKPRATSVLVKFADACVAALAVEGGPSLTK